MRCRKPADAGRGEVTYGCQQPRDDRRQRGGCLGCVPRQRGDCDLSDHAQFDHGGVVRRVAQSRQGQPLGCRPRAGRDAVGSRRGRRGARGAASGRPVHDVHGLPGPAADDPQHVQDCGGADAVHHARRGQGAGDACAVDLRRPLRRHGVPADGVRAPVLELGPGSPRHGSGCARRQPGVAGALSAFLRRLPHVARSREDDDAERR